MKKVLHVLSKNRWYIAGFFLLTFTFYVRFFLPSPLLVYENYHGVDFLNRVYGDASCTYTCYTIRDFIVDVQMYIPGGATSVGYIPKLIYSFVIHSIYNSPNTVFYIQGIISILTGLLYSVGVYMLTKKSLSVAYLNFIIFITAPFFIRYGLSEDYYVVGNFFIALGLVNCILFFKHPRFFSLFFMVFSILGAVYTREQYLLTLPFFILLGIYIVSEKKSLKDFLNLLLYKRFYVLCCLLGVGVFQRLPNLFSGNQKFTGVQVSFYESLSKFSLLQEFIPYIYVAFSIISLLYGLTKIKRAVFIVPYATYLLLIAYFYSQLQISTISLLRHTHLLLPFFMLLVTFGIYVCVKNIRYQRAVKVFYTLVSLYCITLPFLYKNEINFKYTPQEEFSFIEKNLGNLGAKYTLIIPEGGEIIRYSFPYYLFNFLGSVDISFYSPTSFLEKYPDVPEKDTIFFLSSGCYMFGYSETPKSINGQCKKILDTFEMEPIKTKTLLKKEYAYPIFSTNNLLPVGFYKLKEKKK